MSKIIEGGVTTPEGFTAGGIHCGVKNNSGDKKDLALILSRQECTAAAMYTMNRVKAAPLYVTMSHLEDGIAWGVVANSGNANACAPGGHENAEAMCAAAAKATGRRAEDFVVASTGVIGQSLNIDAIEAGMPALAKALKKEGGAEDAAAAIMTTDTKMKKAAVRTLIAGKPVTLGAIAKGSGMIHPNMGTMLCFITSDCAISREMLHDALHAVVPVTFNRVTVDGDTSTNDTCAILCNGMAGNDFIEWKDEKYDSFVEALKTLCTYLARMMASDGEGATKLITCTVSHARGEETAERLAKAVVGSSLVKAALFGADANWGRVLCAMGYSKAPFRPESVEVRFASDAGEILVCRGGEGIAFSEEEAKKILTRDEVEILIDVNEGDGEATCWGCDLTYDYVKINGDYRT